MKAFVTGIKSGLGKYLHNEIGGDGLHRDSIIIHCAHSTSNFDDNIRLISSLVKLPHKYFIFISSIDIYRDCENGKNKLACEAIVEEHSNNYLIIRLPLILGEFQRPNCISRIMSGEKKITLSGDSEMFFIWDHDVLQFIDKAIEFSLTGTVTLTEEKPVVLKDLATKFNPNIEFGSFVYKVEMNGKKV